MSPAEVQNVAGRLVADYDAGRANEIFAGRESDWLTLDDAYTIQRTAAELRRARGERCVGYKIGCVSAVIQKQFGLTQPVRGYVWETEALVSGCRVTTAQPSRFVNLAIEGEVAIQLGRPVSPDGPVEDLAASVERAFPVIELHNYVFRGDRPTSQELVAGNAMHAGFVRPASPQACLARLDAAEIQIEIDGRVVETAKVSTLPGGPLGSLRWLAVSLASIGEALNPGDLVLTGSPGRLIPVAIPSAVTVTCEGLRVEAMIS